MGQKFYADPKTRYEYSNGAVGFRPSPTFDTLGPYAKVSFCPIRGTEDKEGNPLRLTCYATAHADTHFSVPASTQHRAKYVGGFFTRDSDDNIEFVPNDKYKPLLPMKAN